MKTVENGYITAETKLPETVVFEMQPYGCGVVGDLKLKWYNGRPYLSGTYISGTETSRLFHATCTKSIAGQHCEIYGVREDELASGHIVRVAM